MALLMGAIVSTWLAVRESRAKTEAVLSKNQSVEAQRAAEKAEKSEREARLQADAERTEATHNLYLANMTLAQQAWDENYFGRLRQVLEDIKESPYRGFEWYYW